MEYLVWDEKRKKFVENEEYFYIDSDGELKELEGFYNRTLTSAVYCKPFFYINKTDINNKKIYADCSVVELDYYFDDVGKETFKAYFEFREDLLKYDLIDLENNISISYCPSRVKNLKIIGTLQEGY